MQQSHLHLKLLMCRLLVGANDEKLCNVADSFNFINKRPHYIVLWVVLQLALILLLMSFALKVSLML